MNLNNINNYKLTIELVPSSSWYNNVRSNAPKEIWDIIRKKSYRKSNYKCEICGDNGKNQGYQHPVECHEIWEYKDETKIQKLIGFISLCPNCHKTKHTGLSIIKNEKNIVVNQLMKINNISKKESLKYIDDSFDIWEKRSKFNWHVDISYMDKYYKN